MSGKKGKHGYAGIGVGSTTRQKYIFVKLDTKEGETLETVGGSGQEKDLRVNVK